MLRLSMCVCVQAGVCVCLQFNSAFFLCALNPGSHSGQMNKHLIIKLRVRVGFVRRRIEAVGNDLSEVCTTTLRFDCSFSKAFFLAHPS